MVLLMQRTKIYSESSDTLLKSNFLWMQVKYEYKILSTFSLIGYYFEYNFTNLPTPFANLANKTNSRHGKFYIVVSYCGLEAPSRHVITAFDGMIHRCQSKIQR